MPRPAAARRPRKSAGPPKAPRKPRLAKAEAPLEAEATQDAAASPPLPPDDATLVIRNAIRAYVPDAIRELARLASEASSEQARVSAINALIDRGYGNLKQATDGDDAAHDITVRFVAPAEKPRDRDP